MPKSPRLSKPKRVSYLQSIRANTETALVAAMHANLARRGENASRTGQDAEDGIKEQTALPQADTTEGEAPAAGPENSSTGSQVKRQ